MPGIKVDELNMYKILIDKLKSQLAGAPFISYSGTVICLCGELQAHKSATLIKLFKTTTAFVATYVLKN